MEKAVGVIDIRAEKCLRNTDCMSNVELSLNSVKGIHLERAERYLVRDCKSTKFTFFQTP